MPEVTEREKVRNPFQMGPSTEYRMPSRLMEEFAPMPRSSFQSSANGTAIVETLLNFADVGSSLYVERMNKKIQEDKIIQTGLAIDGVRPTDKATVAGYRAHAAVSLKGQMIGAQARLNEKAKQGLTDEEWDKAVREEYRAIDKYMADNYHNYTTDKEMQKLVPISFREAMPQIQSVRESDKIKREIEARVNSVSDSLINMSSLSEESGFIMSPEDLSKSITEETSGLQLTSDQKDKAVVNAITTSRSPSLLAASKVWKGDRKTNLFERSASLQKLEVQLKNEAISKEAVALETEFQSYKNGVLSGDMLLQDGLAAIDARNKELNGKFATRGAVSSLLNDYYKKLAGDTEMFQVKELLADQSITDADHIPEKKKKAGYKSIYEDLLNEARNKAAKLPQDQQQEAFQTMVKQAISEVSDMAVTKNDTLVPFVNALSNLATSNIAMRAEKTPEGVPVLDNTTKSAITILDSMSPTAKVKHLEAVGAREARVIRAFMAYRDRGMTEPQALSQAQSFLTQVGPVDQKRVLKGIDEVRDNLESLWKPDFEDRQSAYLEEQIANQIALSPEPDDEANIDMVTEWMRTAWTTSGNLRLKGSPGYLRKATGFDPEKLEKCFEGFVWSQRESWYPMIQGLGIDESEVFPITDPEKGTMQIVARSSYHNANVYLGNPIPLGDLRKYAAQYKEHQQKLATEHEDFDREFERIRQEMQELKYGKGLY